MMKEIENKSFFFSQTSMNVNVSMGIVQMMSTSTSVSVNLALRVADVIQVWNPCIFNQTSRLFFAIS